MIQKVYRAVKIAFGLIILLVVAQGSPMASEAQLVASGQRVCLDCHRQPNINTNEGVLTSRAFCNSQCHTSPDCTRQAGGTKVSLQVSPDTFKNTPHQYAACIHCHTDVARSPHQTQSGAQCSQCHWLHGEGTAHTPHLRVDCQACHFKSNIVRLNEKTHRIELAHVNQEKQPIGLVDHGLRDVSQNQSCERCHQRGNSIGAPAVVLPAKSLLCIMCHPCSFEMGHPLFWTALIILMVGILFMVRFWFLGSAGGEEKSLHRKISRSSDAVWQTIFSKQIFILLKTFFLDILLQRRILQGSVQRWSMHSLIYLAIMARFLLSIFTGLLFSISPDSELALALIDKNSPFTAFANDFLGLCIGLGILWAAIQRFVIKPAHVISEIEDNITLALLGGLVVVGFLTTGARILLTQIPNSLAVYSFIGFPISATLGILPIDWRWAYPVLWYTHAILGAAFVAYLPFGKLKHIFNVPLTYFMEEVSGTKKEPQA